MSILSQLLLSRMGAAAACAAQRVRHRLRVRASAAARPCRFVQNMMKLKCVSCAGACPQRLRASNHAPVATARNAAAAALGCTVYNVWSGNSVARFIKVQQRCNLSGAIHGKYEDGAFSGVASLQAALSGTKAADASRHTAEEVLRQPGRTAARLLCCARGPRLCGDAHWASRLGQPGHRVYGGEGILATPQVDAFLSAMALTHSVVVDTDAPESAAGIPVYAKAVFSGP